MLLIGAALTLALSTAAQSQRPQASTAVQTDVATSVRRAAATAQLAAQEYRIGVEGGRIVAQAEVDEARLFLQESRRAAASLPSRTDIAPATAVDSLLALVSAVAPPDSLDGAVRAFAAALAGHYDVVLDQLPAKAPSSLRGAQIWDNCAGCHGDAGAGNGPLGASLDPPPADLTRAADLRDASPLDFYRRVTIGVVGTAMPAFETPLSTDDRWAVAAYADTAPPPRPQGRSRVAPGFGVSARLSDASSWPPLARRRQLRGHARPPSRRCAPLPGNRRPGGDGAVFDAGPGKQLDSTYALAHEGRARPRAPDRALDAYMTFEQVERSSGQESRLAADLEGRICRFVPGPPAPEPRPSWTEFAGSSTPIWRTPSGHLADQPSATSTSSYNRLSFCCGKASRQFCWWAP